MAKKNTPVQLGDGYLRTCNKDYIQAWIDCNGPGGLAKLCLLIGVSESLVNKARAGRAPAMPYNREAFCKALNVPMDKLFPLIKKTKAG